KPNGAPSLNSATRQQSSPIVKTQTSLTTRPDHQRHLSAAGEGVFTDRRRGPQEVFRGIVTFFSCCLFLSQNLGVSAADNTTFNVDGLREGSVPA
ncbi:hypothetical protein NHN26_00005, partial [Rhodovulum tesquicola]|uniref:hypothetical protein n=1 Tax=Rhodovulum tesquicola TaxID=540254 RepID=UPI002096BDC9